MIKKSYGKGEPNSNLSLTKPYGWGHNFGRKRSHLNFAPASDDPDDQILPDELNCADMNPMEVPSCLNARQFLDIMEASPAEG